MKNIKLCLRIIILIVAQGTINAAELASPSSSPWFPAENHTEDTVSPVKVIWDTDMQWDWDDAGALAILHALADEGEVNILGIGSSVRGDAGKWNPHTIDIINTYYHRPGIPIGKSLSGPGLEDVYGKWIADQGLVDYNLDPDQVWDNVVDLYRKLLSEQPDTSVVLVTVGYTSNIRDLLLSEPDEYSDLNGRDLVAEKVDFWSCMGGRYPGSGAEANFQDWKGHTKYAIDNFPRPILGTSSETGNVSGAGSSLEFSPTSNPVRAIYRKRLDDRGYPNTFSHATWDPIATLVAVRDARQYFDITSSGTNVITLDGSNKTFNEWKSLPDNGYRYLIQTNPGYVSSVLDDLMGRAPGLEDPNPTLNMNISGVGRVDIIGGNIGSDSLVWLNAKAGNCYEFSHWSGDLTGTVNPVTIYINNDKSITAVFTGIAGCVAPDLIAHWPLNETSGTVAADASGNGFDLTLINTDDSNWDNDPVRGQNLKLNGTDEYGQVSMLATAELQLGRFSITSFIKMEKGSVSSWNRVAGITNAFGFNVNEQGKLGMWNNYGSDWHGSYGINSSLDDGQWHHIAMTHDDSAGSVFYVDGTVVLTQNWTDGTGNGIIYPGGKLFKVGTNDGNNNLPGSLQDIRVYNIVLSQSDVLDIMNGLNFTNVAITEGSDVFKLSNFPNPFNPGTTISYSIPHGGFVQLNVYDLLGQEVAALVNREQPAGNYNVEFIASSSKGGVYLCRFQCGGFTETKKLVLSR